ncbi:thioredoxin family protein [Piscinibacter sp. HJYY11]|nr:thioredoxin family protein [Piscinibacter sp. HJYY11]MBL0730042.1 thioredoxin family protein [Piscinibacter sp. HJYY11]
MAGAVAGATLPARAAVSAAQLPDFGAAPEFAGIERWLNSSALTMAGLRGRVVMIDFWTFACINCQRTMPHVNRWAETYTPQGLTLVGVHTPEFPFERSADNVIAAMKRMGIRHPVAQDNRFATWKAYANQYWPATYLVDAKGRIRYKHFGEGEYERTEAVIRALLAER